MSRALITSRLNQFQAERTQCFETIPKAWITGANGSLAGSPRGAASADVPSAQWSTLPSHGRLNQQVGGENDLRQRGIEILSAGLPATSTGLQMACLPLPPTFC